jgi:ATP-dependent helicase HepA
MKMMRGQRWMSEAEPELGLGILLEVDARLIKVHFPASAEVRQYSIEGAPLQRVRFRVGDRIQSHDGAPFTVERVEEREGILYYHGAKTELCESLLADSISFSKPEDRLLKAHIDPQEVFELRHRTLQHIHRMRKLKIRGALGGRVDLIPHQLYLAQEISSRPRPRVLLADEVGLGKTIEACMVLHRLLITGKAGRVLILLPEPLVHQWFVELFRRFNLVASIYDESRCQAIGKENAESNPFLEDHLILCSIDYLASNSERAAQVKSIDWGVVLVDEAHHLEWSPEEPAPKYELVRELSLRTKALLLLTATPEQLGRESHFARLKLLDPDRYFDLETFIAEEKKYTRWASLAVKLHENEPLDEKEVAELQKTFPEMDSKKIDREEILNRLLDQHGIGRVMFRNTRAVIKGFPKRKVKLISLKMPEDQKAFLERMVKEVRFEIGEEKEEESLRNYSFKKDPRLAWLVETLKKSKSRKYLLLCSNKKKAMALYEALKLEINSHYSVFHEDLTLLQRDRNAAWFAEEEGAQLLICSEIGSEGRNFQFVHDLILFDLPLNLELLEQRIGRLDRIGQTATIQIHVPLVQGTGAEAFARALHEGLNAFEKCLEGGSSFTRGFGKEFKKLLLSPTYSEKELKTLISKLQKNHGKIQEQLQEGRDKLLELNSYRPRVAQQVVKEIAAIDAETTLDEYMISLFDHFGVHIEEASDRTYILSRGNLFTDAFPFIPAEGTMVTTDRKKALSREEIGFLTWEHPMMTGAMELLLTSEKGNSAFSHWEESGEADLLLESVFVLEPIAPAELNSDRFLPLTPLRVLVNRKGEEIGDEFPAESLSPKLKEGKALQLHEQSELLNLMIPKLVASSLQHATIAADQIRARSLKEMDQALKKEILRLTALKKVNPGITKAEIEELEKERSLLQEHLSNAQVRLDSVRLIMRTR